MPKLQLIRNIFFLEILFLSRMRQVGLF